VSSHRCFCCISNANIIKLSIKVENFGVNPCTMTTYLNTFTFSTTLVKHLLSMKHQRLAITAMSKMRGMYPCSIWLLRSSTASVYRELLTYKHQPRMHYMGSHYGAFAFDLEIFVSETFLKLLFMYRFYVI